ncbi:hypothetical protein ACSBR1_015842 [Camellia fascicularis]
MHILHELANNCLDIATEKSGWCVLQHCLAHSQGEPVNRLVAEIAINELVHSESCYGNYVMQFILAMMEPYVQHAKAYIFAQLAGNYVNLSFNKYRSNVVEKCLKEAGEDQAAQIIKEIINSPNFLMLVQDPYGNYVAQSAMMVSKGCVRQAILTVIEVKAEGMTEWSRALRGIVFLVAKDKRGCLYMQKKIEEANFEKTEMLFFELKDHITQILLLVISDERCFMTICCDTHGTHAMVVHCLLDQSHEWQSHNCLDIATEKSGCCVLQHCLAHSQGELVNRLVAKIAANTLVLSESRCGNYVMQFILAMKEPYVQHAKADIFAQLAGNYVSLSFNKYRSNVVEKCLKEAGEDQAAQIIKEIINSPNFLMLV